MKKNYLKIQDPKKKKKPVPNPRVEKKKKKKKKKKNTSKHLKNTSKLGGGCNHW